MKKTRSISAKNITGGICGGFLGILTLGYVHVIGLPIGCLLGVLIGWWYEVIIQKSMDGWRRGENFSREICEKIHGRGVTFTNRVINIDYLYPFKMALGICIGVINIFFVIPRVISQWVRTRPMCAIHFVNALASVAAALITTLWLVPLFFYISGKMNNVDLGSDPYTLLGIAQLVILLVVFMSLLASFMDSPEEREDFYRAWDRYERLGFVKSFLLGIVQVVSIQIALMITLISVVMWYVCVGGSFLIMVLAPIGLVVGTVKGFYHVSKKTDHWLCLGSTLFVTVISAWMMNPYFGNPQVLWGVALMTGVVAALFTEALRRIIIYFCDEIALLRKWTRNTLGELTKSPRCQFGKITSSVRGYYFAPLAYVMRKLQI